MSLMTTTETQQVPQQTNAQVTIIVVPRERFSCTQRSLESIYEYTTLPFELVYVDGNSPPNVHRYLQTEAVQRNFHLLHTPYYLTPNQARNLGLAHVQTQYVVFIDNDVIVSAGWLEALVQCSEETDADIVGPLMCQDEPIHEVIHFAGGESHIWTDNTGRKRLREKMYKQGKQVADVRDRLQRTPTELAEFHCVLVRTAIFQRSGYLDEQMMNTKEHLDFCMTVTQLGGKIYFEPASVVTYVPGPPIEWSDMTFYMLRWSDAWTLTSLHRLRDKWNLAEDGYFQHRYKNVSWRRVMTIIVPVVSRVTFGHRSKILERVLMRCDRPFNRFLTTRHAKQQAQHLQNTPLQSITLPNTSDLNSQPTPPTALSQN